MARHSRGISGALAAAATALIACGRGAPAGGPVPDDEPRAPVATAVVPEARLFVLEAFGAPPADTVVRFEAGAPRVIILRHAPPDNSPFAELAFPANAFDGGGEVEVAVTIVPGVYGLEFTASRPFRPVARLVFKYPLHFAAPGGARERYRSDVLFEQALVIGNVMQDGRVALLPSARPAADNLSAVIPGDGRFLVVAPR